MIKIDRYKFFKVLLEIDKTFPLKDILIHCIEKMTSEKKFIRFYSPKDPYFEFSNFYVHKTPLIIDHQEYKSVEHYFQSQKYNTDLGRNLDFMILIIKQNTPGQAKMLANPIKKARWEWEKKLKSLREEYEKDLHFDPVDWNSIRDSVMLKGLMAKFTQDPHCKNLLLSTGDSILSENTSRDKYWGNGGNPDKIGRLGELLMEVRSKIIN